MFVNEEFICISGMDFGDAFRGSKQNIALELSKNNNRVLYVEYVEPSKTLFNIFKYPRFVGGKILRWLKGVRLENKNLYIYSPPPVMLPLGERFSIIESINQCLLKVLVKRVVKKLAFSKPILWIFIYNAADLIGSFNEKLSCYHCVDEWSALQTDNPKIGRNIKREEERILKKADIVFTVSIPLFESKRTVNSNTHYLPLAADFFQFNQAMSDRTKIPEDIEKIVRPKIGFIGSIVANKVDLDLIYFMGHSRPGWSFIFVGPISKSVNISRFSRLDNIHFLGYKKLHQLPGYLKDFDVAIIPYLLNEVTKGVSPLKLYEYLAAGKPVVSTNIPEAYPLKEVIKIADNKDAFISNIEYLLKNDTKEDVQKRLDVARQNTWNKRVMVFSELMAKTLSNKIKKRENNG